MPKTAMLLQFPRKFPADDIELLVPDAATARALVSARRPDLLTLLQRRRERISAVPQWQLHHAADVERGENTLLIAFCRLALRHGSWGTDFHAYHNEEHILEILGSRIDCLLEHVGIDGLALRDWYLLSLFAAGHDLRQRETPQFVAGVGSNEQASIEETFRILQICGFDDATSLALYKSMALMIAGSTFDARPAPNDLEYNSAELAQSGGALAQRLDRKLDAHLPNWRSDEDLQHALPLALLAADLDTANVAAPFPVFAASAERLCREREMRSHRSLQDEVSAAPVLAFLTDGQERYFFDLHRFHSDIGRATFEAAKQENAARLQAQTMALRARVAMHGMPKTGDEVIAIYRQVVAGIA